MKRIAVPDTDLSLCPIGLGTLGAGLKWDGEAADRIFDSYLAMGGNLIDTARVYQDWVPGEVGRSERVVGDWLQRSGKRRQVILMTKGGHPKNTCPEDDIHLSRMTPEDMRGDLEKSLRTLKTDWIDVYFYHRDNLNQSVAMEIETMEAFRKEGKIRYYACSNWSAERMREADAYCASHGYRGFVADQALLNLGMKYMKPLSDDTLTYIQGDISDYHRENTRNLAVAYYCSANGFFHRLLKNPEAADENYRTPGNLQAVDLIRILMDKYSASVTQVILGFLTVQDFPCAALYGPSSVERMADAMKTLELSFQKEDFQEVFA